MKKYRVIIWPHTASKPKFVWFSAVRVEVTVQPGGYNDRMVVSALGVAGERLGTYRDVIGWRRA